MKRILALVLALAMIAVFAVGCGDKGADENAVQPYAEHGDHACNLGGCLFGIP